MTNGSTTVSKQAEADQLMQRPGIINISTTALTSSLVQLKILTITRAQIYYCVTLYGSSASKAAILADNYASCLVFGNNGSELLVSASSDRY